MKKLPSDAAKYIHGTILTIDGGSLGRHILLIFILMFHIRRG